MAKKEQQPEKPRETTVEFLASLAGVLVTGLFIITFVIQAFEIPSASMENTLLIGDHVFVNRVQFSPPTRWVGPIVPYGQIHHGDIVVFLSPAEPDLYVVKRIIGIPGENVIGRPMFIYWSFETPEDQYQKKEMSERAKFLANVVIHFFDKTRWSRSLKAVR